MADRRPSLLLAARRPSRAAGVATAIVAITFTTLALYPLREVAPAVSLGVVYLLSVLLDLHLLGSAGSASRPRSLSALGVQLLPHPAHRAVHDRRAARTGSRWPRTSRRGDRGLGIAEPARARARRGRAAPARGGPRRRARAPAARRREPGRRARARRAADRGGARAAVGGDHHRAGRERRAAPRVPLHRRASRSARCSCRAARRRRCPRRSSERIVPALETLMAAALDREALCARSSSRLRCGARDELKTAILRAVSHDLRSPLTAMVAAGEAARLARSRRGGPRASWRRRSSSEGARLTRLIEKLLDLSRLQAGAAEPRRDWTSIEEVSRAAVEAIGAGRRPRQPRARPRPAADRRRRRAARARVREPARERRCATPAARPVSVRARASAAARLLVRIVDRGPGIPPAEQERIFEPFYRAPGRRAASRARGSGWRSSRASSRPTAAACTSSRCPGRARASSSRCRSRAAPERPLHEPEAASA